MLVIELPALSHTKVRCENCEGPAPADLPPVVAHQAIMPSQWLQVGRLPLDFKVAAAGEDD